MNKSKIIREYLESLKEDKELDVIFPTLLEAMNFRIVTTPRNSKGCDQYGKDVVAIGRGEDGRVYRWYFELKGNAAKDITNTTFNMADGVRESLLAAKDVPYVDSAIPSFNRLPHKIVFVHNGILHENAKVQYEQFIQAHFAEGEFERWDIEKLVGLFAAHLFDECMLSDDALYKMLKKILLMCDAPGWKEDDVRTLTKQICGQCNVDNKRQVISTIAGLKLILSMIYEVSQEAKNLLPAKKSSDVMVLLTWGWILNNRLEGKKYVIETFDELVDLHLNIYQEYLDKLRRIARTYKGLYMREGEIEKVMYPIRCYDYLADVLYYFNAVRRWQNRKMVQIMQDELMRVIEMNSGFDVLLLDTQSIPLLMLVRFLFANDCSEENQDKFVRYINKVLTNLMRRKRHSKMFPELYGNRKACAKSLYEKSDEYVDSSSLLMVVLIEIIAWLGYEEWYKLLRKEILDAKVNLQVAYPIPDEELEVKMFDHRLMKEICVETNIQLHETLKEFKESFVKRYDPLEMRTQKTGYGFLMILAHVYYKTDMFPDYVNFGFWKRMEDRGE